MSPSEEVKFPNVRGLYLRKYGICGFGDIHEKFTDFSQQQNTTKKIIKAPTHLYESISASTLGLKYAFLTDVAKMPSS